jgi:ubiquitin-protein ligase
MSANKFLIQQYKELNNHPLYNIVAVPKEDNIKEWCGNVFFDKNSAYPGLIVHFFLTFDNEYPNSSPNLSLATTLNHTHVFGQSCCFSLLPDFKSYFESINLAKSAYWNPSRTVRSFLEGFYQFLTVDVDRESHGKGEVTELNRTEAMRNSSSFTCSKCGHTFNKPNPSCPEITEQEALKYDEEKLGKGEVLSEIEQAIADLNCSISGKSIKETIIGFGVKVENGRNGMTITTDLFPISYDSFYKDNVRLSSGGAEITHWIPFVVNEENWVKAREVACESMSLIKTGKKSSFEISFVLDVIGELWKTKAVEMMKGEEHASEKVLVGFCAFHHLLLAFCKSYPKLVEIATQKVRTFIKSPNDRNKSSCPDFGRFLPLFLISDILWEDETHAGRVCVSELFTRNAMWILKQHPELSSPSKDLERITKSWEPSQVGLKLTCFQIRYILEVGRPPSESDIYKNFERLNSLAGRPTVQMTQKFQQTVKGVQKIVDYPTWFQAMGLGKPPDSAILKMLQDAMNNSEIQGYHGGKSYSSRGRGRGR